MGSTSIRKNEVDFIHKFLHKDGFRQLKTSTLFFISIICICILLNDDGLKLKYFTLIKMLLSKIRDIFEKYFVKNQNP